MSYAEFVNLVKKLRTAQKSYYRFKVPETLRQAKALELQVDAAIVQLQADVA